MSEVKQPQTQSTAAPQQKEQSSAKRASSADGWVMDKRLKSSDRKLNAAIKKTHFVAE